LKKIAGVSFDNAVHSFRGFAAIITAIVKSEPMMIGKE
jgi:hypothetical protein